MQYSEIVGIESFFDSTFNITEERENYWKQFITNEKFESNLKSIINVFTSLTSDQHKSIWVQGTYGTGKSHSTSVIKHLLSDELDDINDYIEKLVNPQLKAMLLNFRKKERVFPVVLKGTYSIVDTEELKYTIQRAVVQQLEEAGVTITVKSDFQAVIEMLEDKKFESFWQIMLKNELSRYASTVDELKDLLESGDIEVLKEINTALKKSNMIKATPDIKQWLTEVMNELRKQRVADYLVIFWDEFTSLLEISERRSILNCMQDIAELSKAPRKDDSSKCIGVYVFLVTHKSMEATDSYKELKEDEKTMAKARFLGLQYDMQDITTYHIISNALNIDLDSNKHPLNNHYFEELPEAFQDHALIDRFHGFIEGWYLPRISEDLKLNGYALNVEYFSEILSYIRTQSFYSAIVKELLDIPKNADTRDTNAVVKMCSAYLKLLYPHVRSASDISPQEFKMVCFDPAFEKRKIIRQQLAAIDREFTDRMPDIKVRGL